MLTFGSLFTGIGGIDLGLERAGMECRWQVEIDEHCQRVLAKHWPSVSRLRDVRDVSKSTVEAVDLICGGFPCQPVSVAGKREGQSDLRWLWPEFARVVAELRPRWVLLENVPGLLTQQDGAGASVVADLAAMGYDAEWGCISASAFGAPYRRSRWFCVATARRQRRGTWRPTPDENKPRAIFHDKRCSEDGTNINEPRPSLRQSEPGDTRQERSPFVGTGWWAAEPDVVRVVSGVRNRVDRIRGLGNAVVPQVAEWIGKQILTTSAG